MATASSFTSEHAAIVRPTVVWATLTALISTMVALPFLLVGPLFVVMSLKNQVTGGEAAGCAIASGLAALFLYGVIGSVVRSTVHVRRSPGYPARHWWFVGRAYRSILKAQIVLLVAGLGLTTYAVCGHGWLSEWAAVGAAVADGGFLFLPSLALLGMNGVLRHARVVPYFPRRVGETGTYPFGTNLARHVAELDEVAISLGVTPLSSFGWNDDMEKETLAWQDSSKGLRTVNALLSFLETGEIPWDDRSETVADLRRIDDALKRAADQGIPFCLLLIHCTATNANEWEMRKGTCF